MPRKKHSITLLEVLIGLVLAGIILSFLFSLLRQTLEKKQEIAQLKQTIFPREMMRLRMNQIINSLAKNESNIWIDSYEDHPALSFCYENRDKDVNFCGMIHSMLYVNEHKQLVLSTFSKQDSKRDEILLENIHTFTFELFDQTKAIWKSEWLKTKAQLPEMVRLHLKTDQDNYDLVLFVTEPKNPIIYGVKS
ncbi:MAG TPA: type II secretion system protein [Candidatus Rhabdochlamydia sp.]|jgi:type II secretory pathway component PulJ|nr:type II secretion system protein [Candidatus Rhabdochlamydia sp.]